MGQIVETAPKLHDDENLVGSKPVVPTVAEIEGWKRKEIAAEEVGESKKRAADVLIYSTSIFT